MKKDSRNDSKIYDVIVIGAGSGGLNIAGFMNKAGFKVLLIDREDRAIGGDCLNHGCVPSKALIHNARLVKSARGSQKLGLTTQGAVDIEKVMGYIREKMEHIREHENAEYFRKQGMDVVLGLASFVDGKTIEVLGVRYAGRKIIIATGSRPRSLSIPGIEKVEVYTNENIFSLKTLPQKMVVIGAGPIGVEIGQAMSAFGTHVSIIGSKLLDKEDSEIVLPLQQALIEDGIDLYVGYKPIEFKNASTLVIENDKGERRDVDFDLLFVSIGRVLNIEKLNLATAGVQTNEKGIVVDQYLRTTNKNILVCGDVAGGHMFTHAAELHASVIIKNFFSPFKQKLNTDSMAWVTYTSPEIATFGLNEKTLIERGVKYEVVTKEFIEDDRSIIDDHAGGKMKILLSPRGIVLGGSMVSHNAGELAQELMLLQSNKLSLDTLLKKVYPYPTATRVNRSLALSYKARSLTPWVKKLLRLLY